MTMWKRLTSLFGYEEPGVMRPIKVTFPKTRVSLTIYYTDTVLIKFITLSILRRDGVTKRISPVSDVILTYFSLR